MTNLMRGKDFNNTHYQGCPEGGVGGVCVAPLGKNLKGKIETPLEFWKFSELSSWREVV
jgi:hypothetical protein